MSKGSTRVSECKRAAARLNRLLEYVFEYAPRKGLIDRPFQAYDALAEEWADYAEGWEGQVRGMLACAAVFGSRTRVAAFLRASKRMLPEDLLGMVRRWRERPWVFAACELLSASEDDLVEVAPLGDPPSSWAAPVSEATEWSKIIVYSPALADIFRHGGRLAIAQLWDSGGSFRTYQTYGVIIGLASLEPSDLEYYADVAWLSTEPGPEAELAGLRGRSTDICDVMAAQPLQFLRLMRWGAVPSAATRGLAMYRCVAASDLGPAAAVADAERWREVIEASGERCAHTALSDDAAAVYLGSGSPMHDPAVYLSYSLSRCYLTAMTEEAYRRGRKAVAALCRFPEQPDVQVSMVGFAAAEQVFGYRDTVRLLEDRFSLDPDDSGDEDPMEYLRPDFTGEPGSEASDESELPDTLTRETLDALMARIVANRNEGRDETDAEIATALEVEPETVSAVRRKIEAMFGNLDSGFQAADRFGLSPRAFHGLTRRWLPQEPGALVLRAPAEITTELERAGLNAENTLRRAPVMRFCLWFLNKLEEEGAVPATQAGYVAPRLVTEAFDARLVSAGLSDEVREIVRPKREIDCRPFYDYRTLLERAGLIEYNGKRFAAGAQLQQVTDSAVLYRRLFETTFAQMEWDYHRYLAPVPFLRESAGFLFYAVGELSSRAGSKRADGPAEANAPAWSALRQPRRRSRRQSRRRSLLNRSRGRRGLAYAA